MVVIQLHEIKGMPHILFFFFCLYEDFKVVCYQDDRKIAVRDLVAGFSAKFEWYSELDSIILRLKKHCPNIQDLLNYKNPCQQQKIENYDMHRVQSLIKKQNIQNAKPCGNRYPLDSSQSIPTKSKFF